MVSNREKYEIKFHHLQMSELKKYRGFFLSTKGAKEEASDIKKRTAIIKKNTTNIKVKNLELLNIIFLE